MGDNPLGLSDEQATQSGAGDFLEWLRSNIEKNRKMISDLPPGTIIRTVGWGGPYPDRTREEWLELYG